MSDAEVPSADALEQDELPERDEVAPVRPASSPDVPEADALEQATPGGSAPAPPTGRKDPEAPEADWLEQSQVEPEPDEDRD